MIFWGIYLFMVPLVLIVYFDKFPQLFSSKKKHKIELDLENRPVKREYLLTIISLLIFGGFGVLMGYFIESGHSMVYTTFKPSPWEYVYLVISLFAILGIHDIYFYLTHRLLHVKPIFKSIHLAHHKSHDANPWSSFSFHPIEGVVQIAIIAIIPIIIPVHLYVLLFFAFFLMFISVYGHCGYELRPNKNKTLLVFNTSLHHYQHHKHVRYNFGLYLNFWDKVFETNKPGYQDDLNLLSDRILENKNS